jgi:hypothetical protein
LKQSEPFEKCEYPYAFTLQLTETEHGALLHLARRWMPEGPADAEQILPAIVMQALCDIDRIEAAILATGKRCKDEGMTDAQFIGEMQGRIARLFKRRTTGAR